MGLNPENVFLDGLAAGNQSHLFNIFYFEAMNELYPRFKARRIFITVRGLHH